MDAKKPNQGFRLKRRHLLQMLTTLFVGREAVAADSAKAVGHAQKNASTAPTKPSISLEQFMSLSQYLTQLESLDPQVGAAILADLGRERVWHDDLVQLVAAIAQAQSRGISDPGNFLLSHNSLKDLIQEILTAWFVGVRVIDKRPKLYTYFDALMFRAVDGVRNIPSICGGALNFWSEPPKT